MPGRPVEGESELPLDDRQMARPEAERQPVAASALDGERLRGQGDRMPGVGLHHGRAQLDPRDQLPRQRRHRQRVPAEDLVEEDAVQPGLRGQPDRVEGRLHTRQSADVQAYPHESPSNMNPAFTFCAHPTVR